MKFTFDVTVSVIVTTYNRKAYLLKTIKSILSQTYEDFELIIVDDGSTDGTDEMVNRINDSRITYIRLKNWGGPARPRNVGINRARGKYLAFCDDDDLWVDSKLEIQLQCVEKENIVGVGSTTYLFYGDDIKNSYYKKKEKKILDYYDILREGHGVPFSSLLIKNNGLLFDESKNFIAVEDFDFQLRLLRDSKKKLMLLSEPLVYYRIQTNNISRSIKNTENILFVLKKYNNDLSRREYNTILFARYYSISRLLTKRGDYQKTTEFIGKMFLYYPFTFSSLLKIIKFFALYIWSVFRNCCVFKK